MTRERAKELLPVIQAYAEGKAIQYKERNESLWVDCTENPSWWSDFEYRIKPEPRRFWIVGFGDNTAEVFYNSKDAHRYAERVSAKVIEVEEVLP